VDILYKLDPKERYAIDLIKDVCKLKHIDVYIVGGAVRDILMGIKVHDIDICLNANPMIVIENISEIESFKYHEKFQTASVKFKNGVNIDLIRCRCEIYEFSGALPKVEPSDIVHDLYRRDFTINALAYNLNSKQLIDLYDGISHIKKGIIKKIHIESYREDPTRIFRAIRYAARYGFSIEDRDEIAGCLEDKVLKSISNDRIIREIYLICTEEKWTDSFILLGKFNIFLIDYNFIGKPNSIAEYKDINMRFLNLFYSVKNKSDIVSLMDNSILDSDLKKSIIYLSKNEQILKQSLKDSKDNYSIYLVLKDIPKYSMSYLGWNCEFKYKLYNYINNISKCTLDIDGNKIKSFGVDSGKCIGNILKDILKLKLNTGIEVGENLEEIEDVFEYKNRKF
jgi:tRNA nucleotidyltransferase/poly(A) polymerase